jgi:DNA-binding transcriptional LysR family regulator
MFDYRQLQCFLAVADEGQITRAAAKLHVAQPALSQSIAKLEADVGFTLLHRHSRGASLTAAGEAFVPKARTALRAAEDAKAALAPWARQGRQLLLGYLPSTQGIVRPIVRRVRERFPDAEVEMRKLGITTRLLALKAGEIDAEVLYPRPHDPDLVIETIARARRYVLLSESHRLAAQDSLVFEQISGETFPGRHPSVSEEWAEEAWLTRYRGREPIVTAETPLTLDEVWTLISSNKAIAVLPEFMVPSTVGAGVRAVPLTDVEPVELALARRRDDTRSSVAALFDVAHELAGAGGQAERPLAEPGRRANADR